VSKETVLGFVGLMVRDERKKHRPVEKGQAGQAAGGKNKPSKENWISAGRL